MTVLKAAWIKFANSYLNLLLANIYRKDLCIISNESSVGQLLAFQVDNLS